MPLSRLLGNLVLSHLTRLASGYWTVFDSQCGYTAANRRALATIARGPDVRPLRLPQRPAGRAWARAGLRVQDVPVRPVYGPDWRSGIRIAPRDRPAGQLLLRAIGQRLLRLVALSRPVQELGRSSLRLWRALGPQRALPPG